MASHGHLHGPHDLRGDAYVEVVSESSGWMKRPFSRRLLDIWFPTLARYCGLALIVYAVLFDQGRNPALIPAATGLIFLKTAINGRGGEE